MEVEFDVKVTPGVLYDYLLSHTYRTASGLIGTIVGVLLIMAFAMAHKPPYLIAGIVIIAYIPWTLFIKSRQQYLANASFKQPIHYLLNDEGIRISQEDSEATILWEDTYKAMSTGGSILIYTSKVNACILPKKDLGEKKNSVIAVISTHMDPKKVHIRGN